MSKLAVIAAIPNYNHAESLGALLPQVLGQEQGYDGVVVCDDASTDQGESREVVDAFGNVVEWVGGDENVGAGANRNRVMGSKTLEKMERFGGAIIHFLDADTSLISDGNPEQILEIMSPDDIGAAGGLVRDGKGVQSPLNYGKLLGGPIDFFNAYAAGGLLMGVEAVRQKSSKTAQKLRGKLEWALHDFPDISREPVARDVGWMIEANMMVPSEIFQKVGGFDPKLRFHEIQEFSIQLKKLGLRRRFDPSVEVTQHTIDVRGKQRSVEHLRAASRLMLRYALHTRPRYNRNNVEKETYANEEDY